MKIAKNGKLIFQSFQLITHLSGNLDHFRLGGAVCISLAGKHLQNWIRGAQCAETYEKTIRSFLINDMQTPTPSERADFILVQKIGQCSETNGKSIFRIYAIFSFWDMVNFVLKILIKSIKNDHIFFRPVLFYKISPVLNDCRRVF